MTRARERGRGGRFGGGGDGDGDSEVGTSLAGSCWGGEWEFGLRGIFEGEEEEGEEEEKRVL